MSGGQSTEKHNNLIRKIQKVGMKMDIMSSPAVVWLIGKMGFLLRAAFVFLLCRITVRFIARITDRLLEKSKLEIGIQHYARRALNVIGWILTVLITAQTMGIELTSLVAIASVITLALSLSLQNIFTSVFSGITLLVTKPFVVGDYVEIAGVSGTVKAIDLMRTSLDTVDNRLIQIPNGDVVSAKITNFSAEPVRRVDLAFSASYDAPTELVKQALMEAIQADPRIKTDPAPFVALNQYNANDIEYITRSWVDNKDYWGVYFSLNESVREIFAKYGIEFSYPHTVVHMAEK